MNRRKKIKEVKSKSYAAGFKESYKEKKCRNDRRITSANEKALKIMKRGKKTAKQKQL